MGAVARCSQLVSRALSLLDQLDHGLVDRFLVVIGMRPDGCCTRRTIGALRQPERLAYVWKRGDVIDYGIPDVGNNRFFAFFTEACVNLRELAAGAGDIVARRSITVGHGSTMVRSEDHLAFGGSASSRIRR